VFTTDQLEDCQTDERLSCIVFTIVRSRQRTSTDPDNWLLAGNDTGVAVLNGSSICWGPFCERELAFVQKHHPAIFEVGAGTFYAGAHLRNLGLDILAVDTGHYLTSGITFPWQTEEDRRMLALGDYSELLEQESEKRTLLISWPEPQAPYAGKALRRYREYPEVKTSRSN